MGFQGVVLAGRRLFDSTLVDSATLRRRVIASDGTGGQTETFHDDATPAPCRFGSIVDPSPVEQVEGVFGIPTAQVFFSLEAAVALHEGDRVVNLADGSVWVVVGNKTAASGFAVVNRVLIREV